MPLPIRLVAMDMDDTLLQDDWTISERTINAIRQAQKKEFMSRSPPEEQRLRSGLMQNS